METPVPFQCRHRFDGAGKLLSVLCFLALPWLARAELQFDVFVGYGLGANDGVVAEASWIPVTCEIYNDGSSFDGVVELAGGQGGQTYSVPVELPQGTRKRLLVPVYSSGRWLSLDARLRDARGRVRASHSQLQPRLYTDRHSPLIGSLSRTLSGAVILPEITTQNSQLHPTVARLAAELFPDNPIALDGLSVLYLSPAKALELKTGQVTALLAWLHGGGNLIVAAEQPGDINAVPWLRQILPCEITSTAMQAEHGALQAWLSSDARQPAPGQVPGATPRPRPVPRVRPPAGAPSQRAVITNRPGLLAEVIPPKISSTSNPFAQLTVDNDFESAALPVAVVTRRDGTNFIGSDANPLAIKCARGRGSLTMLLFNPELEPFKSWKHKAWFWAKLTDVPIEWLAGWNFARASGNSVDAVFGALIDSRQIRKLPIGWLFVLLLAYLAVIGPVDHYVLKKLNKQMLTWLTFPAYVAFFSVLIYYIGYRLRAGETEWNEFHVIDVIPHGERADLRGHSYGSVYSPANLQYPVANEAPYATLRGERDNFGTELSKVAIEQTGNSFKGRLNAPIWTSQLFLSDWWRQGSAPLQVTVLSRAENELEIKVENLTGKQIPQAALIWGGFLYRIGELPRAKTFKLSGQGGEPLAGFVRNRQNTFQNAINQRRSQFGGGRQVFIDDGLTTAIAASFLSVGPMQGNPQQYQYQPYAGVVASRDFDLGPNLQRGDLVLLAWLPGETLLAPLNKFNPRRSHRDTVLRVVVPGK